MDNLFVGNPQVRVSFFPQSSVTLGKPIVLATDTDSDSLLAVQTQKDLNQPAGHFTVTLTPTRLEQGRQFVEILRPGDLVLIEMGPDKPQPDSRYQKLVKQFGYSGLEPVMLGSIDDVRESTIFNAQDGKPERTVNVTGRDFGKYLVDDQVWWDSWSQPQRALYGLAPEVDQWLRAAKTDGVAAGLIALLMAWMKEHFDIEFTLTHKNHKKLFKDLFRYSLTTNSPSVAAPLNLLAYQGAPWALMERTASAPIFRLHTDMRRQIDIDRLQLSSGLKHLDNKLHSQFNTKAGHWDSQPVLMFYRNPWSNRHYQGDWTNLPTRVVEDSDLISRDIGRSSEEVSNTWRVWTEAQGVFRTAGGGSMNDAQGLRDLDSIQRYGERPLIITTPYISGLGGVDQKELVRRYSYRLKDWNRWNEWLLNGRIQMKGMASVKVGDRLWHWDQDFGSYTTHSFMNGVDYYVEGVAQEFRCFSGWTTTVTVTRGQIHRTLGSEIDFKDITVTASDLKNSESTHLLDLRDAAKQVWVWGNIR